MLADMDGRDVRVMAAWVDAAYSQEEEREEGRMVTGGAAAHEARGRKMNAVEVRARELVFTSMHLCARLGA